MESIATAEDQVLPIHRDPNRLCITDFASLPEGTIIDQTKLAEILGVTTRTVRRMICRYEIPQPIKLCGHSVWTVKVLNDYINQKLQKGAELSRKSLMAITNN